MEAAVLKDYGSDPEFGEFEEPVANGRALVEVSVAGLNPVDHTIASGRFPDREPPLPSVPGLEGIGVAEGRRVYFDAPVAPFGSMGERTLVESEELIEVPDGVEDGLAVSFGISGLAAWLALTWRAELQGGESVLVLGSSGVLGQIAVQSARLLGAGRIVAAARDTESLDHASHELGADAVVELGDEGDLTERFKEAAGGGFDVVVDPLWGEPAVAALGALNVEGRLVQIGNSAGESVELSTRGFRNQLGRIIGHTNFKASQERKRDAFAAMCRHALAGELRVETEGVPLREVGQAWNRKSPHRKLVIEVSPGEHGRTEETATSDFDAEQRLQGPKPRGSAGESRRSVTIPPVSRSRRRARVRPRVSSGQSERWKNADMQQVRIGCSGWSYKDWRGGLYPDGLPQRRWLERYAEIFGTVEVNATFYRLPRESTVRSWVEQVPSDFLFAVKASRYLTHMKRLREIADAVARFWEPLESLRQGRRLGPVLWQLPENFQRDDDLLASALDQLPRARHCFEFRHPSWFAPPVHQLLEERGASLAIGDDKRRPLPEARPVGELAYLRLHYGHRGRGGNYSEAELDGWRRRIASWRSRREVFVYLNNDWEGYAPANARYLLRGLSTDDSG